MSGTVTKRVTKPNVAEKEIKPPSDSLMIRCEGSGAPNVGYCQMCAATFPGAPTIPNHDRMDVLAMLARGDFDAR